jgi:hypothetical protein
MFNLVSRSRSAIIISAGRKSRMRPMETTCGVSRKWEAHTPSSSTPASTVAGRL